MTVSNLKTHQADKPKPKRGASKPKRHTQLQKLLTRKSGVTIAQLQKTFGWQPHTSRAAISAQRKAGCVVSRTDTDKGSVYRIVDRGGDE